jgi:DNA mismatch endonuclease (patch repair protein)
MATKRRKRRILTKSQSMGRVRQKDTKPEILLRKELWRRGLRYRLHDKSLPGTPDIVFPAARVAVFVHGCFWHSHGCSRAAKAPQTNADFWQAKLDRNRERDTAATARLAEAGWSPLVVWECEQVDAAATRVAHALAKEPTASGEAAT